MRGRWLKKGLAFLVFGLGLVALLSFSVMALWNALIPSLFAGPVLHYWQAAGLLVLSRILFGGLRGRGWHGHRHRHGWRARWERLTPEERERLRDSFRNWKQMTPEQRAAARQSFCNRFDSTVGGPAEPSQGA